jgi:hypothetical protein
LRFARAPPAVDLNPAETGAHDQQDHDEDLGGAPQLRRLPRDLGPDADTGAGTRAGGPRRRRHDFARRRGALGETFGGRRCREIGIGFDDRELERGSVGAEPDDVAVAQQCIGGDALPVHERPVATPQILEHESFGLPHDRRVAGRDVEVTLGIEAHVRQGMAAKADVTLAVGFDLPRAGPGEKPELCFH